MVDHLTLWQTQWQALRSLILGSKQIDGCPSMSSANPKVCIRCILSTSGSANRISSGAVPTDPARSGPLTDLLPGLVVPVSHQYDRSGGGIPLNVRRAGNIVVDEICPGNEGLDVTLFQGGDRTGKDNIRLCF